MDAKANTFDVKSNWLHVSKRLVLSNNVVHNDRTRAEEITSILEPLCIDDRTAARVGATFRAQIDAALAHRPSSLQMENTFVQDLPNGSESGIYLALDLGGTNFRTILLELREGHVEREIVRPYHVSDELRLGDGEKLFAYLAECLRDFVDHRLPDDIRLPEKSPIPLGFTFSFPMHQFGLADGRLVTWTKSFCCDRVVGRDVVRLLNDALEAEARRSTPGKAVRKITVVAILNDTTGTLVQGASMDRRTRIGIVLGTGSNACYVERAALLDDCRTSRNEHVIVDVEWGAFGDDGSLDFIRTAFDRELDARSLLINSFTFEKYIGGKYLGELVRGVLEHLWRRRLFCDGGSPESLFPGPWTFNSDRVSEVEKDIVNNESKRCEQILCDWGFGNRSNGDDVRILQHVVALIGLRAARLVAENTAVLLERIAASKDGNSVKRRDEVTVIAIDGSLYKHHPRLKAWLEMYIGHIVPQHKFELMLAEDGSGKGAGLIAAIAERLQTE